MLDPHRLAELARAAMLEAEAKFIATVIVEGDALAADVCQAWHLGMSLAMATFSGTLRVAAESAPISMNSLMAGLYRKHPEAELAKRVHEIVALERLGEG